MCQKLDLFLGKNGDALPNIMGMTGIALLTVIVSIAVLVFKNKEKDFEILDKSINLYKIVNARYFLFYLFLVYVPLLLWFISPPLLRFVGIIVWLIGIVLMAKVLLRAGDWIGAERKRFKIRFDYLQGLKEPEEIISSWHSVWEVEGMDAYKEEKKFFIIFSSTIDKLLNDNVEKIRVALGLISDFNLFIDKRSVALLVIFKEFFPKNLDWHFSVWEKRHQVINEKDKSFEWATYNQLSSTLSFTLEKVEERALKEGQPYSFFNAFEAHVEKYKKHSAERKRGGKEYYVEEIIPVFFNTLVENMKDSSNMYDIWGHYFPSNWKITMENIKEPENYVSRMLWSTFSYWASSRILGLMQYDNVLTNVANNLFPRSCPILWARILAFAMRSWSGNRMESLIEGPQNFGGVGRPSAGWMGDSEEAEKKVREDMARQNEEEEKETIALALCLFGRRYEFTEKGLNEYIKELEDMAEKYNNDRGMESERKEYFRIFKMLQDACREKSVKK